VNATESDKDDWPDSSSSTTDIQQSSSQPHSTSPFPVTLTALSTDETTAGVLSTDLASISFTSARVDGTLVSHAATPSRRRNMAVSPYYFYTV